MKKQEAVEHAIKLLEEWVEVESHDTNWEEDFDWLIETKETISTLQIIWEDMENDQQV